MVHLAPQTGAPLCGGDLQKVLDGALQDSRTLEDGEVNAGKVLVELTL